MKKLLFAMAVGASLAWAFDPDQGPRRRELVRQKLTDSGLVKQSSSSAYTSNTYATGTTAGH